MPLLLTYILAFFTRSSLDTGRVVMTLYALQLGAQPFTVGALAAVLSVLPTLFSWHVGRISDRFGARWLLILCLLAGALGMLVPYLLPALPSLFFTAAMYGLLSALSAAPLQTLVGLLSAPGRQAQNYSNFGLVVATATLVGPLLAGFTFEHGGPDMACLGLVVYLMIPAALLIGWGGVMPGGTRNGKPAEGVLTLLSESGLWRVLVTSGLVVTCIDVFQVYIPIYGHGLGMSASAIGTVLAVYSLAAFVVRLFLTSLIDRFTMERVLACSLLVGAAGFLLIPVTGGAEALALLSFVFGLGMGCGQPMTMMMTFSGSSRGRSGEAMGLRFTANHLMRAFGQVLFGGVAAALGPFFVFLLNALVLAAGGAASLPRKSEHRPQRP